MFICPRSIEFRFRLLFNFTQSDRGFADRQRSIGARLLFCSSFCVLYDVFSSTFLSSDGVQSSYNKFYNIRKSEIKPDISSNFET